MYEEDYLEVQGSESEEIYDSGGENDPGQKTASSLAEKGREVIKKWVEKLKPEKSNTSSLFPSDDSYYMEDEDFSSKSETFYEEEGDGERMEKTKTKKFLEEFCQDKMLMRTERPELQIRMAGEEHDNIPNLPDEVDGNGSSKLSGTSQFPIQEWLEIEGEWRYRYRSG